jgi:hypothetical protein
MFFSSLFVIGSVTQLRFVCEYNVSLLYQRNLDDAQRLSVYEVVVFEKRQFQLTTKAK